MYLHRLALCHALLALYCISITLGPILQINDYRGSRNKVNALCYSHSRVIAPDDGV
ncbi:hypothetical protein BDW22DRAFT_1358228 [Trametopsis cervina]|nr:hypothetical protein BDW22DRAFT_1358228 [Trametopsis cervina]